jgi:hypothetical protein
MRSFSVTRILKSVAFWHDAICAQDAEYHLAPGHRFMTLSCSSSQLPGPDPNGLRLTPNNLSPDGLARDGGVLTVTILVLSWCNR